MELEEEEPLTSSPFWLQNSDRHRNRRRLRRSYSLILTSTSFLVLLLVAALAFAFIVVPTLHSFASHILKPHTVKKSWDSLNLVLVLFAIVCGFLSRNTSNETPTPTPTPRSYEDRNRSFSNPKWEEIEYSDSTDYRSISRLRSFNSYPDLRHVSPWVSADQRWGFHDDTRLLRRWNLELEEEETVIKSVVTVTSEEVGAAPPHTAEVPPQTPVAERTVGVRRNVDRIYQEELIEKPSIAALPARRTEGVRRNAKRTYEGEVIEKPSTPPPPPPPPAPSTRTEGVPRNPRRTYQAEVIQKPSIATPPVTRTEGVRRNGERTYQAEVIEKPSTPPLPQPPPAPSMRTEVVLRNPRRTYQAEVIEKPSTPPPPPPPPPPKSPVTAARKTVQGKKKRGNATREFLTSLRGKKKQRQRSVENFDTILINSELLSQPPPSTPPPPPPPPPPSVFQNLFSSNKGKHKKHHFAPPSAPRSKASKENVAINKQGFSNKRENCYGLEDKVMINTGKESPLIPIPPPPPLPPFKLPGWKFRVQGDFVRVDSIGSSRSGSPDLDEVVDSPMSQDQEESSQCSTPSAPDGGENGNGIATTSATSMFCPSPDVDTKAHTFIERFRAGLRMEKMNSMKQKPGVGRSNLGASTYTQT